MTERLFLDNPTLATTSATVIHAAAGGIVLDRTVFYARNGGQPGDTGLLRWNGAETAITDTLKGPDDTILHVPAADATLPPVGTVVEAVLDWQRRHALMRMHTALHLLCSLISGAPGLVRTLSVQPPRGTGRLRLIHIGTAGSLVDLQPCGGTHVSRTGEIGPIRVLKIENKGKQNRRITIAPANITASA
jgi:misacylated tRNA(Ala) deacylase